MKATLRRNIENIDRQRELIEEVNESIKNIISFIYDLKFSKQSHLLRIINDLFIKTKKLEDVRKRIVKNLMEEKGEGKC